MISTTQSKAGGGGARPLAPANLLILLVAGAVATAAFDLFGQWLTPTLGFARLAPEPLAAQTLQTVFGPFEGAALGGAIVHWLTGILAYPVGYVFIARPVARVVTPFLPWPVVAAVYGVALWVFALYVMAHLVNGNPAFLAFTGITWVALIGHVLWAAVFAAIWETARR